MFSTIYRFLTIVANFKQNESCAKCFDAILSNRTVAHGVLNKFQLFNEVSSFKQNDSCANCFDTNFNQLASCTRCFRQVIAFQQQSQTLRKTTVAQSVLTPLLINWTGLDWRRVFLTSFSFSTIVANFKKNDSCGECFDANFEQQNSCARCFGKVLHCQQKTPTSSKPLVAQSLYTQISSNTTVAHGVLDKFQLFNNSCKLQEKRQLRRVF